MDENALTIKITNQKQLAKWFGEWVKDLSATKQLFASVAAFQLQQIFRTFKADGARDGAPRWVRFSARTLHPSWYRKDGARRELFIDGSRWNRRPGTDGAKTRRYSASSQLLRASGGFRNSFHVVQLLDDRVIVGTLMDIARHIIGSEESGHQRQVIQVSAKDLSAFRRMVVDYFLPPEVPAQ